MVPFMRLEISKDLENLLVHVSKKYSLDPQSMALKALTEYLEDQYDYHVGMASYNDYIQNGRKSISLEDLKKDLGL